ncbi:MAG: dephospho-CoA kinase [Pontimonas sp.]|nr:dephospho-CoA kinase [Pontimonas sp.]
MTVVALTGGVAAGKSTVTDVLSGLGAHVIDADVLARQAVEPGTPAFRDIVARFGSVVVDSSGGLDRAALGDIVFGDPEARESLNAIVHPEVKKLYDEALTEATQFPSRVTVYAVPLLAEARSATEFDAVIVVHAPATSRVFRLMEHRGLSADQANARVAAQASDEERVALADSIVDASGDIERTRKAAHQLYEELERLWPDRLDELSRRFPRDDS